MGMLLTTEIHFVETNKQTNKQVMSVGAMTTAVPTQLSTEPIVHTNLSIDPESGTLHNTLEIVQLSNVAHAKQQQQYEMVL